MSLVLTVIGISVHRVGSVGKRRHGRTVTAPRVPMVVIVAPPCETTVISPGPPNTIRGVRVAQPLTGPAGSR